MDKERLNHVIGHVIRRGTDVEQLAKKAEKLQAELEEYKNRRNYGDYNFSIKVQKIDVPKWIRDVLSEENIEAEIDDMASGNIRSLIERLKRQFRWIDDAWKDGHSGGWIAIKEEGNLFESMVSAKLMQDVPEMKGYINEMELTLRDLAKIEKVIDRSVQDFVRFVESDKFWEGVE